MNGKWFVVFGSLLAALCYAINQPYITLTSFLAGYTLSCDRGEVQFSLSFFALLTILYNLKLYGLI